MMITGRNNKMYIKALVVTVCFVLSGCGAPTEVTKKAKPIATPVSISSSTISSVRSAVRKKMKDPSSVQFGQYKALKLTDNETKSSTIAVCGKYNAKNSYGGYVGESMFLAEQNNDGSWSVIAGGIGTLMCSNAGFATTVGGDFI